MIEARDSDLEVSCLSFIRPHITKLIAILCISLLAAGAAEAKTYKSSSSKSSTKSSKRVKKSLRHRGQQGIDADRAREIQTALIKEKYLSGEPSGKWDQRTKDAMTEYQADHGWQTKVLPDSRALIQLGLGPSKDNLINPETAATAQPQVNSMVRDNGMRPGGGMPQR